jgi:chaperonin GroEL
MLEDMAILTSGQVISEDLGIKLENVSLDMLGTAKKIRIDKDNTTIIDGSGKKKDIEARCARSVSNRNDNLGLRQRKAARTSRQAGGRRCGYPRRRRDGSRGKGTQGTR